MRLRTKYYPTELLILCICVDGFIWHLLVIFGLNNIWKTLRETQIKLQLNHFVTARSIEFLIEATTQGTHTSSFARVKVWIQIGIEGLFFNLIKFSMEMEMRFSGFCRYKWNEWVNGFLPSIQTYIPQHNYAHD